MRDSFKGWYHLSDRDSSEIFYHGDAEHAPETMSYGPFKTFGEAKRDAIAYHQTDVTTARIAIDEIKKIKKADVI